MANTQDTDRSFEPKSSSSLVLLSGCSHRSAESSTESAHELGKLIASSRFTPSVRKKNTLAIFLICLDLCRGPKEARLSTGPY